MGGAPRSDRLAAYPGLITPGDPRCNSNVDSMRASPLKSACMDSQSDPQAKFPGAGGTPGGIGIFFLGVAMACAGGWLLTDHVTVSSQFFASGFMVPVINYRMNSFGLS